MLNEEFRSHSPTSPLHQKRHLRSICLSGCFSGMSTHPFDVLDNDADYYHNSNNRRARTPPPRSPLPEIKGRCMQLISKIGGGVRSGRVRRRNASADFSYDPSSYALNFEDDACKADDQLLNGFSARLSASSIPTTPHERKIIINTHRRDKVFTVIHHIYKERLHVFIFTYLIHQEYAARGACV